MQRATVGGIPGAADIRSRVLNGSTRQYQGAFAFFAEDQAAITELYEAGTRVELEGLIDGEMGRLPVFLTYLSLDAGIVYFAGSGEPTRNAEPAERDVRGA